MAKTIVSAWIVLILVVVTPAIEPKKIVNLGVGEYCAPDAAPVGPGGSWQVINTDMVKLCPIGTFCMKGACNCLDLPDGTVLSHSVDSHGVRSCKRIAGQKCSSDNECFEDVSCTKGLCTCKPTLPCVNIKQDIYILN